jgi:GT2 family glycosyltransferase
MKLSIVILNYLTYDKTISCVESLGLDSKLINHIIIVDNSSNNSSLEEISNFFVKQGFDFEYLKEINSIATKKYILFQNETNSGFAKGNNIGIDIALNCNSDYILILNNDVQIHEEAISNLLEFINDKSDVGCVGPVIREGMSYDFNFARKRLKWFDHFLLSGIVKSLSPKLFLKHHFVSYNKIPEYPFEVDMISGSCMLFPSSVLKEINGFDKNTFLYFEEAIITEKLLKINKKTYVVPTSIIEHEHAGSIKKITPTKIFKHGMDSQFYYLNKIRGYNSFFTRFIMIGQYITFFIILIRTKTRKNENSY